MSFEVPNKSSSPTIQPPFPQPTQHFCRQPVRSILLYMQWNLPFSQRHLLLKRLHIFKKTPPFLQRSFCTIPTLQTFPFLTKDLFIGCAWETTPFSQRLCFPFFQRAIPKYRLKFRNTFPDLFFKGFDPSFHFFVLVDGALLEAAFEAALEGALLASWINSFTWSLAALLALVTSTSNSFKAGKPKCCFAQTSFSLFARLANSCCCPMPFCFPCLVSMVEAFTNASSRSWIWPPVISLALFAFFIASFIASSGSSSSSSSFPEALSSWSLMASKSPPALPLPFPLPFPFPFSLPFCKACPGVSNLCNMLEEGLDHCSWKTSSSSEVGWYSIPCFQVFPLKAFFNFSTSWVSVYSQTPQVEDSLPLILPDSKWAHISSSVHSSNNFFQLTHFSLCKWEVWAPTSWDWWWNLGAFFSRNHRATARLFSFLFFCSCSFCCCLDWLLKWVWCWLHTLECSCFDIIFFKDSAAASGSSSSVALATFSCNVISSSLLRFLLVKAVAPFFAEGFFKTFPFFGPSFFKWFLFTFMTFLLAFPIKRFFSNLATLFQKKVFFKACWCTLFFQKVFLFFRDCPFGFGNYCPEFQEKLFFKACWCTLFFQKVFLFFRDCPFGFGNYCPEFQEKLFFKACWCTLFFQKVFLFFRDCPFGFGNYCSNFEPKFCYTTFFTKKNLTKT